MLKHGNQFYGLDTAAIDTPPTRPTVFFRHNLSFRELR